MRRLCLIASIVMLKVLASPAVPAGDGRIPIWEPVVVTESGSYVVTRNVTGGGIIIDVESTATDVDIDLNGFTVESTDSGPTVRIQGVAGATQGSVTLRNGSVLAAPSTLAIIPTTVSDNDSWVFAGRQVQSNGRLQITNVGGVSIADLDAAGVEVSGLLSRPVTGSIRSSRFVNADGSGVQIVNGSAFLVRDVSIENPGGDGLHTDNCDGCRFEAIQIQDAGARGVFVSGGAGNQFTDVTAFRCGIGFLVDALSQGNLFRNVNSNFSLTGGHGFDNQGSQTHLSQGTFTGNAGGGIRNTGSELNIRLTISRGNAPPNFNDQGFGTWDDGSNCLD